MPGLPQVYAGTAVGAHHHPTRRELLGSIPVLGTGSLLLPLGAGTGAPTGPFREAAMVTGQECALATGVSPLANAIRYLL